MKKPNFKYIEYETPIYARRKMFNRASNDWNDEPEYKMQKVRVRGETTDGKQFVVDSYGNFVFRVNKEDIFIGVIK